VVIASLRWLNVSGVYLVQVFLLLIGLQGLGQFFRYRPLPPIRLSLEDCANFTPTPKENSRSLVHNYTGTALVISRNDKNKQLTIMKPSQTGIDRKNKLLAL
jgi:hypothetical protein